MTYEYLKKEIRLKNYEECISILNTYIQIHPNDDKALTLRGMKHWGAGERALAINDYLLAIKINPNSIAKAALEASNEILDYRNTDLFNP